MGQKVAQPAGKETAKTVQPQQAAVAEGQKPSPQGREAALLNLQRTHGNQHVKQMLKGGILQRQCAACGQAIAGGECTSCAKKGSLQRKLTIGASHDPLEQEAERVADQVMAASVHSVISSTPPHIQRFTGQTAGQADMPAPAGVDRVLSSPGRPLEPALQQDMGQRFGHDFSRVRVHADTQAADSARALAAKAYTVGRHVVFGQGNYASATDQGRRLLVHELAHVVQQGAARPTPLAMLRFSTQSEENDAQGAVQAVLSEQSIPSLQSALPSIARTDDPSAKPGPPTDLPTGQKVVIQWGDDYATTVNARALSTGARNGPNAAGARVILMENLTEKSLLNVREVAIVIHGESDWNTDGTRVIKEGEAAPRAECGLVGVPKGMVGPIQQVTPAEMAERLHRAGFGSGRWTTYRVNLVMCYAGVGKAESYGSRLSGEMASRNVRTEVLGPLGRVQATGTGVTEALPLGQSPPKARARPQPGIPQVEKYYEPPFDTLLRRPGTGLQRTQASPPTPPAPVAPQQPISGASAVAPGKTPPQTPQPTSVKPPVQPTVTPVTPTSATSPATPARKPQTPPAAKIVGQPFQTPSNAAATAYERAQVKGGAAVMALQGFGMLLTNLGDATQQNAAETAFYAKLTEITEKLDKNPGMGVIIEFVFYRTEPLPDSVIQPSDRFDSINFYPAQSSQDVPAGSYPLPKGTQLRIRRRWIKPTKPAPERQAGQSADSRTPTSIQSIENLDKALSPIRQHAHVSSTDMVLAFKVATRTFANVRIDVGGLLLDVTNAVYNQALPKLEQEATAKLTRKLDDLDGTLRDLKLRYDEYSREGGFTQFLNQREFELPPPTLLNNAMGSAQSAREWLGKRDFEMARNHLRTGKEWARKVDFLLFHYGHGHRHWLEDE